MPEAVASKASATGFSDLEARLRGSIHRPGDEAYEEACRIWNAMVERRPAMVRPVATSTSSPATTTAVRLQTTASTTSGSPR